MHSTVSISLIPQPPQCLLNGPMNNVTMVAELEAICMGSTTWISPYHG